MNVSKTILLTTILGLGIGAGFLAGKYMGGKNKSAQTSQSTAKKNPLYWVAPMDANFRRDEPGKSPMGMELIPVYADEGVDEGGDEDDRNLVRINPIVENNIGVRTALVTANNTQQIIETVGTIQIDDNNVSVVDVRTEGWIENMPIKAVGDKIKKGQLLFQIYSRPLVSAQDEYLQAVKMGRVNLITATSSRLISLGMNARSIEKLKKRGQSTRLMNIYAPRSGIVTMMGAGEGAFVKPGMNVLRIVDLRTVWAIADVFEDQVQKVRPDQDVFMHINTMPERVWKGKVEYVYPTVNAKTRTVQVRISIDNKDGHLRPDMFSRLTILTDADKPDKDMPTMSAQDMVIIPREALIRTGYSERVILALGDGQYQPAKVVSGEEIGDNIEILSGLNVGEKIVVSSQFLIDSEASLRGTLLRMTPEEPQMKVMDMAPPSEGTTMGTVVSLMSGHGMVTVEHGPIASIDLPAMNMEYMTQPELLTDLQKGDHVSITVLAKPDEDGNFVLSNIEKMDMGQIDMGDEQ